MHSAYQLRRYGWIAKLPLSILTNFEVFAIYDCRVKPSKSDKASHSRIACIKYNSGLFHFSKEKGRENYDNLTPELSIDDKVLKEILKNLYYPDSPYEFSVFTADIPGQIYEKFLGKVIRLTENHRAVIEEKPEVRKAGGVYYTPTYIVDYIVKQTVGKLLDGKKPSGAKNLRILDPACGSGSFLIGAYQFLLDWHLMQYIQDECPGKS